MAAVEFAMIAPLLITLYFGTVEISQGVAIDRKLTMTSRTLADLVSQSSIITTSDMNNIMAATYSVMQPYPTATLSSVVTAIDIDSKGNATVAWSEAQNGAARGKGSTVTVPAALRVPDTMLIWSELSYSYTPLVGYVISGTINLKEQHYTRPRQSQKVTRAT